MAILGRQIATTQIFRDFYDKLTERFSVMKQKQSHHILARLLAEGSDEMNKTQRYFEIKQIYFSEQQREFLGEFLGINSARNYDLEILIKYQPQKNNKGLVLEILRNFLNGSIRAIDTARQLDQYCLSQKPRFWQFNESWRFRRVEKFVEFFKLNCMREAVLQSQKVAADKLMHRTVVNKEIALRDEPLTKEFKTMFHKPVMDNVIQYPKTVGDYLEHFPVDS